MIRLDELIFMKQTQYGVLDSPMFLYKVTQFSSLLAKLGSFCSHAVYDTGVPSSQLKMGRRS